MTAKNARKNRLKATAAQENDTRKKEIGERLRRVRTARGLSQIDIGEACDVSRAAVSQWENGESLAEIAKLEKAAVRLNVPFDWLRTGKGELPQLLIEKPGQTARRAMRFVNMLDAGVWSNSVKQPPFDGAVAELLGGIGEARPYSPTAEVRDWWRIPPEILNSKSHNLRAFRVQSDSLEPAIRQGSYVFIDISQRSPEHGAIFAIDNGISVVLKRLELHATSKTKIGLRDGGNGSGRVQFVLTKKLNIVGRCVGQFAHC